MAKLTALQQWLDRHIITVLTVIFIYLIPLYPKFPLLGLNDTYIAIRVEDMFMVLYVAVFALQVIRKKINLNTILIYLFAAYWIVNFVAYLVGYFVHDAFTFQYLGFLHSARRVEYMIVFFIAASLITKKEDLYFFMKHVVIAAGIVFLYGIGQKFIGLPAVQTMNKEFAQGVILFLRAADRISSTFAGHYDLAAYFVFLAPIILGLHMNLKKHWIFAVFVLGLAVLMLTASRSSFAAYAVATFAYLIVSRRFGYLLIVASITVAFMFTFDAVTSRFEDTFRLRQVFVNEQTGQVITPQEITMDELPSGTAYVPAEGKDVSDEETATNQALLKEELAKQIQSDAKAKGEEVSDEDALALAEQFAAGFTPVVSYTSDISFSNRLLVSWPRSVESVIMNPMLGTGPSSLGEATDSSYFRWLGEVGILGTSLFIAILASLLLLAGKAAWMLPREESGLFWGFAFGLIGLGINGSYIDVFEASKVAFTLWLVAGLIIAAVSVFISQKKKSASDQSS